MSYELSLFNHLEIYKHFNIVAMSHGFNKNTGLQHLYYIQLHIYVQYNYSRSHATKAGSGLSGS